MSEELAPTGEELEVVETPQEPQSPIAPPIEPELTPEQLKAEVARLTREKAEAVRESIKHKKNLQGFEAAKQAAEDAEKTDLQKAQDELARVNGELEASKSVARRHTVLSAVRSEGQKLKVLLNEDALSDLYDAGHFKDLESDDHGKPQDVDSFLKDLIKKKPYILGKQGESPETFAQHGSGGGANIFENIRKQVQEKATSVEPRDLKKAGIH